MTYTNKKKKIEEQVNLGTFYLHNIEEALHYLDMVLDFYINIKNIDYGNNNKKLNHSELFEIELLEYKAKIIDNYIKGDIKQVKNNVKEIKKIKDNLYNILSKLSYDKNKVSIGGIYINIHKNSDNNEYENKDKVNVKTKMTINKKYEKEYTNKLIKLKKQARKYLNKNN